MKHSMLTDRTHSFNQQNPMTTGPMTRRKFLTRTIQAGAILAANNPNARGQVYNLCSEGEVTQRDLINALTDLLGLPRITKRVPFFLALRFAFMKEAFARLLRRQKPPTITRRPLRRIRP